MVVFIDPRFEPDSANAQNSGEWRQNHPHALTEAAGKSARGPDGNRQWRMPLLPRGTPDSLADTRSLRLAEPDIRADKRMGFPRKTP